MGAAVVLAGCASEPRVTLDPLGGAPEDFSLDVTVMTGTDVDPVRQTELYHGRYVLFADGSLHQGVPPSETWGSRWLPDETRVLSREEVAQVWSLSKQLGFTDPSLSDETTNFDLIPPVHGGVIYLIGYSGGGRRWNFIRSNGVTESGDPAVIRLVQKLAELSWTSPTSQPAGYVMPPRYDFGPDPYARYRQPTQK